MRFGAAEHRARQLESPRIAERRSRLDRRAAGHRQPEQFRGLVEGFAERIVDRRREATVAANGLDQQQLRVPTRDKQHQIRRRDAVGEPARQRVGLQMIDGEKRLARRQRQRLAGDGADDQSADQARTARRGDGVDLVQRHARFIQRRRNDLVENFDVGAGGDFRHHAAVDLVCVEL